MHIAPTGFPGHLSGYRLFWFKAPWGFRSFGDELNLAPRRRLSLSQIKSEHIGGVARRELGDKECFRPVRRRARPARPSPRIDACVPHYNISGKTAVRNGGAALRTQQRGQGIPVGSSRSAVRRIHFATGSVATLVGRECPSIEVVG